MNYYEALQKLSSYQQEHLLQFYGDLSLNERKELLTQIEKLDMGELERIFNRRYKLEINNLEPLNCISCSSDPQRALFARIGEAALKDGKMGVLILSGGQGSRLGYNHAKGMYDIGITRSISIFEIHIQRLVRFWREKNIKLHCFIMTSVQNHEEIIGFFENHNYFGYDKSYVHFFIQGCLLTVSDECKLMLESKGKIRYSPNGNGLWYKDIISSDCSKILRESNIEWINVVSVDNVLQNIIDPSFLGAVLHHAVSCGAKVVRKANAEEKIGTICLNNKRSEVLEYYEIPNDILTSRQHSGELLYKYGVILNYLFNIESMRRIDSDQLPVHIAHKKIPVISKVGVMEKPERENAFKFEFLITDLISRMDSCLAYEVPREQEFAPIKNKKGNDSVETARELLQKNGFVL